MSLTNQDKKDIQEIVDKTVNKAVSDLAEVISEFATNVDQRFTGVENRLDNLETKVDNLETKVDNLEGRVGSLESGQIETNLLLHAIEAKLGTVEDKLEALQNDIKEIYRMFNKKQDKLTIMNVKNLTRKERDKYIIDSYNIIKQLAKEEHIKLPS
jgi:peptidoglycan hydrolase CwlO-like protein